MLDVCDATSVDHYFAEREVDLLVCAAGMVRDVPLRSLSEADWNDVHETNLKGAFRCARAVSRGMLRRQKGHLLFISSFSALHPPVGQVAYASAKAGLIGLGHSLARELGPAGIRANVILPGFLETPMTTHLSQLRVDSIRADHTLGRFNTPEQVARFVRFLEEEMPHTSSQVFQLDSRVA